MLSAGLWKTTLFGIRTKFSDVEHVDTEKVKQRLDDPNQKLVDCRDKKEFDVSHIPGSSHVEPNCCDDDVKKLVETMPANASVVCYCSVGYRSSVMARRMKTSATNLGVPLAVSNMEGSIFKWANESKPLVNNEEQPVKLVHPYNSTWGNMLNKELWSEF